MTSSRRSSATYRLPRLKSPGTTDRGCPGSGGTTPPGTERPANPPSRRPVPPGHAGQRAAGDGTDQARGLLGREAKLPRADLRQLSGGPQPGYLKRRDRPADDDDPGGGQQAGQQRIDLLVAASRPDEVEVVQDEHDLFWQLASALTRLGTSRPEVKARARSSASRSPPLKRGQARCSETMMCDQRLTGSSSPGSSETQAKARSWVSAARHCATAIVLPNPAGACTRTSFASPVASCSNRRWRGHPLPARIRRMELARCRHAGIVRLRF